MTCFAKAYLLAFCQLYCQGDGYKSGLYQAPNCLCFDLYDFEAIKHPMSLKIKKSAHIESEEVPTDLLNDGWKY